MNSQSYPCYYPGEFSPPTKYHLNTLHWLLNKPEVHRVNVVLGADRGEGLKQEQKAKLWDMLLKSNFAPQAGIIKSKQHGPISEVHQAFSKDRNLPAFIALHEKASRDQKLQEKFQSFPYFGIQIIPSQFQKYSDKLLEASVNRDDKEARKYLPDDFTDDAVKEYMEIIAPKKQDPEAPEERSPYVDYKGRYTSMFNDGYWNNVFQPIAESLLNEEIKEKIKKQAIEKFKKQNANLTDEQINTYITAFDNIKDKSEVKKKDIIQYDWNELEQLIDRRFGTEIISKPKKEDIVDFKGSEDVVYNQNGLLILLGDIREKCIRYGQKYTWCISRADANNMFYSYRMRLNEPVFYFIFDEDKIQNNPSDKYHAMVIYVDSKGNYTVADSTNSEDKKMSWEEIVKIQPKLKDLKSLIKHIPLTAEEKADYRKYAYWVSDEEYYKYTYDEKYKYIQFGHDLTEEQIRDTPKPLLSRFVATGVANNLPKDVYDSLSQSDKKVLLKNRKKIIEKSHPEETDDVIEKITHLIYGTDLDIKELKVANHLFLNDTKITKLPDNLEVGGDLHLNDTKITKLPDNLEVGGDLHLNNTKITELPDNLEVGGDLHLNNTKITELPDNLKLWRSLNISNTKITKLPDNLEVGESLNISNTEITELPDNLEVRRSLVISNTNITKLPDNLKVGGSLNISNTKITKLPDNLEVGGSLVIINTNITKLPDNLKVGGTIYKDFKLK